MKQKKQKLLLIVSIMITLFVVSCKDDPPTPTPLPIDGCEGVIADLSIANDFDCQKNVDLSGIKALTTVLNPNVTGINLSDSVGRFVDDGTNAWDNLLIDFGGEIDLSENGQLSVKILSSKAVPVLAKLEGGTAQEIWANISIVDQWVEYTFNFGASKGAGNTKLALFMNAANEDGSSEDVYFVDDIKFQPFSCDGVVPDLSIINDFECQQNATAANDGVTVIANPIKSGINKTDSVGLFTDDGTNAWDNLIVIFDEEIDLSVNNQLKIQVYSTKNVPLLAKLEGGTAVEIWGAIDVENEWKEYSFDFSCAAGNGNKKVVLFFNGAETNGTSEDIYYVDNYRFAPKPAPSCEGVTPDLSIISDFECQKNQDLSGIVTLSVVANPFIDCGLNKSDSVGRYADDGTNGWDNIIVDFGAPIDLTTNNILKLKIYSTKMVPLLTKLEGGTSAAVEIGNCCDAADNIDVIDEWKEYSFDYSGQAAESHNKLVLFFNAGNGDGTAEDIYYVDDIRFEEQ